MNSPDLDDLSLPEEDTKVPLSDYIFDAFDITVAAFLMGYTNGKSLKDDTGFVSAISGLTINIWDSFKNSFDAIGFAFIKSNRFPYFTVMYNFVHNLSKYLC